LIPKLLIGNGGWGMGNREWGRSNKGVLSFLSASAGYANKNQIGVLDLVALKKLGIKQGAGG